MSNKIITGFYSTFILVLLITVFVTDCERYNHTLKIHYTNGENSIEQFTHPARNIGDVFNDGCIESDNSKKICGIRKIEVIKVTKIR